MEQLIYGLTAQLRYGRNRRDGLRRQENRSIERRATIRVLMVRKHLG